MGEIGARSGVSVGISLSLGGDDARTVMIAVSSRALRSLRSAQSVVNEKERMAYFVSPLVLTVYTIITRMIESVL